MESERRDRFSHTYTRTHTQTYRNLLQARLGLHLELLVKEGAVVGCRTHGFNSVFMCVCVYVCVCVYEGDDDP
jgi:hypothetical protein